MTPLAEKTSKTTAPKAAPARPAEIVREYGPFPGADNVAGVSHDGQRVWIAGGAQLIAFDPQSGMLYVKTTSNTAAILRLQPPDRSPANPRANEVDADFVNRAPKNPPPSIRCGQTRSGWPSSCQAGCDFKNASITASFSSFSSEQVP